MPELKENFQQLIKKYFMLKENVMIKDIESDKEKLQKLQNNIKRKETILKDVLVALGLSDNASEFSVPSTFSGNSNIMDEISIENFNKNLDVFE